MALCCALLYCVSLAPAGCARLFIRVSRIFFSPAGSNNVQRSANISIKPRRHKRQRENEAGYTIVFLYAWLFASYTDIIARSLLIQTLWCGRNTAQQRWFALLAHIPFPHKFQITSHPCVRHQTTY